MLVRKAARSLVSSSSKHVRRGPQRFYTQKPISQKPIWDSEESGWDYVFKDIDTSPSRLLASSSQQRPSKRPDRAYTMTAREVNVFDEMFDTIFNSYVDATDPRRIGDRRATAGVGKIHSKPINDIATTMRQRFKDVRWTTDLAIHLDRKREEMEHCDTDQQLLDWAMREVFRESERYEEEARKVSQGEPAHDEIPHLQPPWYPHIIAELMKSFRERYGDPYLALSIFDHARHLSIASYVFGCSTFAYNELIATRWQCFRDVRGVCDALEEMRANGIDMDNRTKALAEIVRAEVGERNVWEEESSLSGEEVRSIVGRIEQLIAKPPNPRTRHTVSGRREKKWSASSETWKQDAIQTEPGDDWEFGKWDDLPQKNTRTSGSSI
ncbi:hypothetical protein PHLGIDRAFT_111531 [Phlebiopsis gigantea 11061_1 CR5-6]|uniref:Mtf2-like C-terminal domain-containing protein n=1 Tax=Phlebiopsis gigantea (strain 11061_1 CR5-6) TaxID=745531 RepID=A0A0C3RRT5_PHLG1|nr:hypothetical protein PHLGIDRAFT_111531 [Phlebiopsis gigantea 11061_1 CR5-6]